MSETVAPISIGLSEAPSVGEFAVPSLLRMLKILGAGMITAMGAYGIASESRFIATSNAVMSAYVLDVRTPIEGTVSELSLAAGQPVMQGQLLGRVDNSLSDHQHLDNLRLAEETAQSEADALTAERTALEAQRNALLTRANHHAHAMSERLQQQVLDASHTLAAQQFALSEAEVELGRGHALHDSGILSNADFEKLTANQRVLSEQVKAQRAAVGSIQAQASAMRHGILAEPGTNNDVAYSQQRADEIAMKLAENTRALAAATAQAHQASLTVERETGRDALLSTSELRAPSSGVVWKINAISGEHTVSGSQVLSMVRCEDQFLVAEIPQDRVSQVLLQGKAMIRFAGESGERTGTVLSATGDPQRDTDHKLAATPVGDPTQDLATVFISVDGTREPANHGPACLIGRTARVRIPSTGGNLIARWISERF